MGSLNVEEWTVEQVADWISGLSSPACTYAGHCLAGGMCGKRLLLLGPDSLEAIGVFAIGHQELILEAVERLREFHYESTRDCVSTLALTLAAQAQGLATSLQSERRPRTERLDAQALAGTARTVRAAKALAVRLAAWRVCPPPLPPHPAQALLALALEAATSAQRDRFAEAPARGVSACARALAEAAECVLRDVHDPSALQPPTLLAVNLPPRKRHKGISVRVGPAGSGALVARVAFGSGAGPGVGLGAGALLPGDELIAVNTQVVVGWSASRVEALCADNSQELYLRLRRHARPPPSLRRPRPRHMPPPLLELEVETEVGDLGETAASSDDSTSGSAHPRPRMYRPPPRHLPPRRHSVSGGSPPRQPVWLPSTHPRQTMHASIAAIHTSSTSQHSSPRGRLDKSHSTPAYDRVDQNQGPYTIPEHTPSKSTQQQSWKACSSQLQWALSKRDPPTPPTAAVVAVGAGGGAVIATHYPPLKPVTDDQHAKHTDRPTRNLPTNVVISPPLPRAGNVTMTSSPSAGGGGGVTSSPPSVTSSCVTPLPRAAATPTEDKVDENALLTAIDPTHTASTNSCSLKKASAILSLRRGVSSKALGALGGAAGGAWQRVRAPHHPARWTRRHLQLAAHALYAFRRMDSARASLRVRLQGCTCAPATEVRSKQHAFKVYHTDRAVYFAADSRDAMLAWLHLITRATLQAVPSNAKLETNNQFSETEYSETESDGDTADASPSRSERPSGAGLGAGSSWRRLTGLARSESADSVRTAVADTKYLRFFTRHRKHDKKSKQPPSAVLVPVVSPTASPPPPCVSPQSPSVGGAVGGGGCGEATLRRRRPPAPVGFVTLEEFMLKEQRERKPVFNTSVEPRAGTREAVAHDSLARRLRRVVPDVVYGETPSAPPPAVLAPPPATPPPAVPQRPDVKPVSVPGRDGYEKLVYPDEDDDDDAEAKRLGYEVVPGSPPLPPVPLPLPTPPLAPSRWRDSLRKHRRVHQRAPTTAPRQHAAPPTPPTPPPKPNSWSNASESPSNTRLTLVNNDPMQQCPPTFHAETYSLSRTPRAPPPPPPPRHV